MDQLDAFEKDISRQSFERRRSIKSLTTRTPLVSVSLYLRSISLKIVKTVLRLFVMPFTCCTDIQIQEYRHAFKYYVSPRMHSD